MTRWRDAHGFRARSSAVCFSDDFSSILLVASGSKPGYILPGGGIERDEQPDRAARREACEEAGVAAHSDVRALCWLNDLEKLSITAVYALRVCEVLSTYDDCGRPRCWADLNTARCLLAAIPSQLAVLESALCSLACTCSSTDGSGSAEALQPAVCEHCSALTCAEGLQPCSLPAERLQEAARNRFHAPPQPVELQRMPYYQVRGSLGSSGSGSSSVSVAVVQEPAAVPSAHHSSALATATALHTATQEHAAAATADAAATASSSHSSSSSDSHSNSTAGKGWKPRKAFSAPALVLVAEPAAAVAASGSSSGGSSAAVPVVAPVSHTDALSAARAALAGVRMTRIATAVPVWPLPIASTASTDAPTSAAAP